MTYEFCNKCGKCTKAPSLPWYWCDGDEKYMCKCKKQEFIYTSDTQNEKYI